MKQAELRLDKQKPKQHGSWIHPLLKNKGLQHLSENQIKHLISRMKEIHYRAGEVIVSQDTDNDGYYYLIKNGRANVSRKPEHSSKDIKLANLQQGDGFGEEALFGKHSRTATVTMTESGDLMRLSKKDFAEFLAKPMLNMVSWQEAQQEISNGAVLIDIRDATDYEFNHLPDAINIPLPILRLKLKQLDQSRIYITYCDDGSRSATAGFIMSQNGLKTAILDGGIGILDDTVGFNIEEEFSKLLQDFPALHDNENNMPNSSPSENKQNKEARSAKNYKSIGSTDYWGAPIDDMANTAFDDSSEAKDTLKTAPIFEETPLTAKPKKKEIKSKTTAIKYTTPTKKLTYKKTNNRLRNATVTTLTLMIIVYGGWGVLSPSMQKQATTPPLTNKIVNQPEADKVQKAEAIKPTPKTHPHHVVTPHTSPVIQTKNSPTGLLATDTIINETLIKEPSIPATFEIKETSKKNSIDPATRGFID